MLTFFAFLINLCFVLTIVLAILAGLAIVGAVILGLVYALIWLVTKAN